MTRQHHQPCPLKAQVTSKLHVYTYMYLLYIVGDSTNTKYSPQSTVLGMKIAASKPPKQKPDLTGMHI